MEKSQFSIEVAVVQDNNNNSPSVSRRTRAFHTPHIMTTTRAGDSLESSGDINPITNANYNNSLEMSDSAVPPTPHDQWPNNNNKTFVTRLDLPVEGVTEPGTLPEYVSTFQLPLHQTEGYTNINNSHKATKAAVATALNGATLNLQTGLSFNSPSSTLDGGNYSAGESDLNALDYLDRSCCSCCSEEVFIVDDRETPNNTVDYPNEHQGFEAPFIRYLDKNCLNENMALYSFTTKSEWIVRSPSPLKEERCSSQTQMDNAKDKHLSRSSQNITAAQDKGVDKSNVRNVSRTIGTDEKVPHKDSDNLYNTSRLKPLVVNKGPATMDIKLIDQVKRRPTLHAKSQEQSLLTVHINNESPNGCGIVMESLTGYNNDQFESRPKTNDTGLSFNNSSVIKKRPANIVISDSSCVAIPAQNNDNNSIKARIPEYHSNKFKLEVTKAAIRPPKLTKHLSLPCTDEDLQLTVVEPGPPQTRVLHVPLATKVLIPIVLEEPTPPKTVPKASRKNSATDLEQLKEMAKKLNLSTRRPSYLLWKDRLHHHELSVTEIPESQEEFDSQTLKQHNNHAADNRQKPLSGRVDAVNQALSWLRRELGEMRAQDQTLARTLIQIRQDIKELKLQRFCAEHQEILEDARDLEEEKDIMGELSCEYIHESFSPTLKQVGLTRMNIGSRRFSVF